MNKVTGVVTIALAGVAAFLAPVRGDSSLIRIEPAIAQVVVVAPDGSTRGTGTAFCIFSDNTGSYYLTAKHVVADALASPTQFTVQLTRVVGSAEHFLRNARVVGSGDGDYLDVALVHVGDPRIPTVTFDTQEQGKGEFVDADGFPGSVVANENNRGLELVSVPLHGSIGTPYAGHLLYIVQMSGVQGGYSGSPLYEPATGLVTGMIMSMDSAKADPHVQEAIQQGPGALDQSLNYAVEGAGNILPFIHQTRGHLLVSTDTDARGQDGSVAGVWSTTSHFFRSVAFGGDYRGTRYCRYSTSMRLQDLRFSIQSNAVRSGHVAVLMTENAEPACPAPPIPPNLQNFSLSTGVVKNNSVDLTFSGAPNAPARSNAILHAELADGRLNGAITFNRVDEGPPFNWIIPIDVSLSHEQPISGTWRLDNLATKPVTYGGDYNGKLYCAFSAVVTVDHMEFSADADRVMRAFLQADFNETPTDACSAKPIVENDQLFDFEGGGISDNVVDLRFIGKAENEPRMEATVRAALTNGALQGVIDFRRLDAAPPFQFDAKSDITMSKT